MPASSGHGWLEAGRVGRAGKRCRGVWEGRLGQAWGQCHTPPRHQGWRMAATGVNLTVLASGAGQVLGIRASRTQARNQRVGGMPQRHLAVSASLSWGDRQWRCRAIGCTSPRRYRQQGLYKCKERRAKGGGDHSAVTVPQLDRCNLLPDNKPDQWARILDKKSRVRSLFGWLKNSSGVFSSTICPWSMKITRSATERAKPISCVTQSMVMP